MVGRDPFKVLNAFFAAIRVHGSSGELCAAFETGLELAMTHPEYARWLWEQVRDPAEGYGISEAIVKLLPAEARDD